MAHNPTLLRCDSKKILIGNALQSVPAADAKSIDA
jgi:hypothetical protein